MSLIYAVNVLETAHPDDPQFRQHRRVVASASDGESPAAVDENRTVSYVQEGGLSEYSFSDGEQLLAEFHLSFGNLGDVRNVSEELERTWSQEPQVFMDKSDEEQAPYPCTDEPLPDDYHHHHHDEHINSHVGDVDGSSEESITGIPLSELVLESSEGGPVLRVNATFLEQLNARYARRGSVNRTQSLDGAAVATMAAEDEAEIAENSITTVCQRITGEHEERDCGSRIPLYVTEQMISDSESERGEDATEPRASAANQLLPGDEATPMMLVESAKQVSR